MGVAFASQPKHHLREQLGEGITTQFLNFPPISHALTSYFALLYIWQHSDFPKHMDLAPAVFFP